MKKLLLILLCLPLLFTTCKKEEDNILGCTNLVAMNYNPNATENDGSCTYSIIGKWNVVSMVYDVTEGFYTSGSYPNGDYTVTDITSGVANYELLFSKLTHEFSDNGLMTQIFIDLTSPEDSDTTYSFFSIIEDSIFMSSGQKGVISVTENTLLMDLFHISLDYYPNFESFQFNHTSERE